MSEKERYMSELDKIYHDALSIDDQMTRAEFLGSWIFDFTTYDGYYDVLFARNMLDVLNAIRDKKTFQYILDKDNYKNYLLMCNTKFLSDKLEWGTSIRGAWFLDEECNICDIPVFSMESFVDAINEFVKTEEE